MTNGKVPVRIIFFRPSGSWWDRFILMASPEFTHAAIRISPTYMIEAVAGKGVIRSRFNPHQRGYAMYKVMVTFEEREAIFDFLEKRLGEKYSIWNAIMAGVLYRLGFPTLAEKVDNRWYCFELVLEAFRAAKIDLSPENSGSSILAQDLLASPLLIKEMDV